MTYALEQTRMLGKWEIKMTIDKNDLLNSILSSLSRIDYIKTEEIPGIDLYMDQITTFMESKLKSSKRYPEDKVLTKTMINNYTKNDLLPPPVRKKYSTEHMLLLIFIYYFKNILSINDIQILLKPLTEKHFEAADDDMEMKEIYDRIMKLEMEQIEPVMEDITRCFHIAQDAFPDADTEEKEFLQNFTFICLLCFDVYVKKMLVEKLVDQMPHSGKKDKKNK